MSCVRKSTRIPNWWKVCGRSASSPKPLERWSILISLNAAKVWPAKGSRRRKSPSCEALSHNRLTTPTPTSTCHHPGPGVQRAEPSVWPAVLTTVPVSSSDPFTGRSLRVVDPDPDLRLEHHPLLWGYLLGGEPLPDEHPALDQYGLCHPLIALEMVIKWFALSLKYYFSSVWTALDFAIVTVSVISVAVEDSANLSAVRSLWTLRALKPLRAISRWQGMKVNDLFL